MSRCTACSRVMAINGYRKKCPGTNLECVRCGCVKPPEEFCAVGKGNPDSIGNCCSECAPLIKADIQAEELRYLEFTRSLSQVDFRKCNKCNLTFPIGLFYLRKTKNGTLLPVTTCKTCSNIYSKKWDSENKDKRLKTSRKHNLKRKLNKKPLTIEQAEIKRAKERITSRLYTKLKPEVNWASDAKIRALKINAVPSWVDWLKVKIYYLKKKEYTESFKLVFTVDHIVPLNSDFVCGFHVQDNLQLLQENDNYSKGNREWQDMPDTNDPELLELVRNFKKQNDQNN